MKDPHVHVEKDLLLGHGEIRDLVASVTGLAASAPKTVATGCGRRRPYAMTSHNPDSVTCLGCREHAASEHHQCAGQLAAALEAAACGELPATPTQRRQWAAAAAQHTQLARRYRQGVR